MVLVVASCSGQALCMACITRALSTVISVALTTSAARQFKPGLQQTRASLPSRHAYSAAHTCSECSHQPLQPGATSGGDAAHSIKVTKVSQFSHRQLMLERGQTHHDGAGGVDHVAPCFGVCIHQVDGGQQQLLLQEGALPDLVLALAGLHGRGSSAASSRVHQSWPSLDETRHAQQPAAAASAGKRSPRSHPGFCWPACACQLGCRHIADRQSWPLQMKAGMASPWEFTHKHGRYIIIVVGPAAPDAFACRGVHGSHVHQSSADERTGLASRHKQLSSSLLRLPPMHVALA